MASKNKESNNKKVSTVVKISPISETGDVTKTNTVETNISLVETGEGRILPSRNGPVGLIIQFLNQMAAMGETAMQLSLVLDDGNVPNEPFRLLVKEKGPVSP